MEDQTHIIKERTGVFGWVVRHPMITGAACLLLAFALFAFALDVGAKRGLAHRISDIRAKGEPVTVQDLLASQPNIPDSENRMVRLIPYAKRIYELQISEDRVRLLPMVGSSNPIQTGARWPADQLETAQWYLRQIASDLHGMHEALKLDKSILMIQWATPMHEVNMPELSVIRSAVKAICVEAGVVAELGNQGTAGRCLQEACRLTVWTGPDASIIPALVEIACKGATIDRIERTINRCGLSEDTLRLLQASLHTMQLSPDMKRVIKAERVQFLDTVAFYLLGNDAPGRTTGIPMGWHDTAAVHSWDASAGLDALARIIDAVGGPDAASLKRIQDAKDASTTLDEWYATCSSILLPSVWRTVDLWMRCVGHIRALEVAIAAERYRMARGRWPENPTDLIPVFLSAIPDDPIDGKPIRYAKIPEGIKTWTIASGESNADDGGDVRRLEKYDAKKRPLDYGWVILNPELRGRPAEEQAVTSGPATKSTQGE